MAICLRNILKCQYPKFDVAVVVVHLGRYTLVCCVDVLVSLFWHLSINTSPSQHHSQITVPIPPYSSTSFSSIFLPLAFSQSPLVLPLPLSAPFGSPSPSLSPLWFSLYLSQPFFISSFSPSYRLSIFQHPFPHPLFLPCLSLPLVNTLNKWKNSDISKQLHKQRSATYL